MTDKTPIFSLSNLGNKIVTTAKNFGFFIEVYEGPRKVCRHCRTPTAYDFCSEACGLDYWKNCTEHHYKTSGHRICGYPGCSKQCYVEHGRTLDYCGKKHASEHKAMQDRRQRQHCPQQPHNGHHGNSHQSSSRPQTRSQSDHSSWWSWSSKPATGPIKFYNRDDPYYEFTNFYSAPIEVDRKTWPTTEHYFQAQKFVGTPYEEQIRHFPRPRQAFDFTRDPRVSRWRRNDWESIKEHVMYKALLAKFTQHSYLRKLLLETKERDLIEHSPYDSYWGDGGDGTGKNRLGKLLMQLRHELRSGQKGKKSASILPPIQQEATRENLQQSSQSGQGLGHSGGTPPSSEHGGFTSDSHLLRRPLQEQSSHHPDDPAMNYQSSNNTIDKSPLGPQHPTGYVPAPNRLQSTAPCADHTMEQLQPPSTVSEGLQASSPLVGVTLTSYQTFPAHSGPIAPANSQHRPVTQTEGDLATGEVSMEYTEQGMTDKQEH